jgi:hypothetical protein
MDKIFKSQTSGDKVSVLINKKIHKCILHIMSVDDATEHIKLINNIVSELKKEDIKWVEIETNFTPQFPKNAITYPNKKNNNTVCHIEDFEKFYFLNMQNLIQLHQIRINEVPDKDGWITVIDKKKERREKYNKIKKDIVNLLGDWNLM